MIDDKEFINSQLARFSGLRNYPHTREAQKDLGMALAVFPAKEWAAGYVNDWIQHETVCPMPAEIRRIAWSAVEETEAKPSAAGVLCCPDCREYGGYVWVPGKCFVPCNHASWPRDAVTLKTAKESTSLCPDCREWGAFGWVLRGGRYEHCPNEGLHRGDVSDALLESMNSKAQRERRREPVPAAEPPLADLMPCGLCNNTGRDGQRYCTCAMGKDLKRVEERELWLTT